VLAVTFTDKTSDGDANLIRQIMDNRRGFNKQMKRIRPLLEAALNSSDADSIRILDRLKSQVETLPNEQSSADSSAIKEGQQSAMEEMLYEIDFLKRRQIATGD